MASVTPGEPAVWTNGLSKTFTTNRSEPGFRGAIKGLFAPQRITKDAIVGIDLSIAPGELVLLLGPNGAGKSTLIKVLTGVVRASSGEVRVAGLNPRDDHKQHAMAIGTVFGQRSQLWWDLPIRQSFEILRTIYEIPETDVRRRLNQFDEVLGLSEFWDTRMRHLSLGQRVRADLAGALLHEPAVIFLDEPTIGMDVVAKDQVRRFLRREVQERGCTVLLTTHDMNEVKRLGSRVIVINHGRIVSDGDIGQLLQRFGGSFRVQVSLVDPTAPADVPGFAVTERQGPLVTLAPLRVADRPSATLQEALAQIVHALDVESISIEEDDLEDVMRSVFQDADLNLAPADRDRAAATPTGESLVGHG